MSDHTVMIALALALTIVIAALVAAGAGYLARRDQATYPAALTRAAVAFAGTLTLAAVLTSALVGVGA
ncbi:hypothetical protein [Streptomyces sp. MZ04]|uniref:hypothetical protein n=1 Tax=Streptomyces sp. MZ04 TaxID=2559236 RepID=UPI00107EB03C|nr:hypothetical protein [Streptomyces sp. MZ04]TGA91601.1 hypothetical protein E2651_37810 [Streptomyces sp. MZ04]